MKISVVVWRKTSLRKVFFWCWKCSILWLILRLDMFYILWLEMVGCILHVLLLLSGIAFKLDHASLIVIIIIFVGKIQKNIKPYFVVLLISKEHQNNLWCFLVLIFCCCWWWCCWCWCSFLWWWWWRWWWWCWWWWWWRLW